MGLPLRDFKYPGAPYNVLCITSLLSSNAGNISDAQIRQHKSNGLHKEAGRHPQPVPFTRSRANYDLGSEKPSSISAVYVPGVQNIQVDILSRVWLENEWALHAEVFEWVQTLGVTQKVNLFVSPCNNKMAKYYMQFRDPQACGVHALLDQ